MPADPIAIREATTDDLSAILRFWRTSAYGASPTDDVKSIATLLSRDPSALLIALDGEHIIGSILAGWDGWRGSLYRLAVLDSSRRRGVGSLLVQEAERRLRALGASRIGAIVEIDNEGGQAFWFAQG
jgi:ribosomal protein S18 acetylase RimI-like enzyme